MHRASLPNKFLSGLNNSFSGTTIKNDRSQLKNLNFVRYPNHYQADWIVNHQVKAFNNTRVKCQNSLFSLSFVFTKAKLKRKMFC